MKHLKIRFLSTIALIALSLTLVSNEGVLKATPDSGTCNRGTDLTDATLVYDSFCSGSTSTISCTNGLNQFISNSTVLSGSGSFNCDGVNDVFCCAEFSSLENCLEGGLQKRRITKLICRTQ